MVERVLVNRLAPLFIQDSCKCSTRQLRTTFVDFRFGVDGVGRVLGGIVELRSVRSATFGLLRGGAGTEPPLGERRVGKPVLQ